MAGVPIDHLLFGAPNLAEAIDDMERRLGVRAVLGGHHPRFGTHNALLSLGPRTYLELIAPNPEGPTPDRGLPFGLQGVSEPGLITWVLAPEDIDAATAAAAEVGEELGPIESGRRRRADGGEVTWRATDPYAERMGGALPFLIAWGDTPHPGGSAPAGGELVELRLRHPEPGRLAATLAALGATLAVSQGPDPGLAAVIRTPDGRVVELN